MRRAEGVNGQSQLYTYSQLEDEDTTPGSNGPPNTLRNINDGQGQPQVYRPWEHKRACRGYPRSTDYIQGEKMKEEDIQKGGTSLAAVSHRGTEIHSRKSLGWQIGKVHISIYG